MTPSSPGYPVAERSGYSAPEAVAPFLGGIEKLARAWPGRTVALIDEKLDGAEGTVSEPPIALRLEGAGVTVLPVSETTGWDDIARRVAEADPGRGRLRHGA